jgi:hypothetical protein
MQLQSRHPSLGRALPARGCQRLWSTAHRRPLQSHIACWQQRSRLRCRAAGESEASSEDRKIKSTLADLDAILGIQEEEPAAAAQVRPRAGVA